MAGFPTPAARPRFSLRRKVLLGFVAVLLAAMAWLHFTGAAGTHGISSEDMDWNGDGTVTESEIAQAFYAVVVKQTKEGPRQCNTFAWRRNGETIRMDCKTVFDAGAASGKE
ncbi:EF-hand domain-containing protein [Pseudoxanthomonas putridarboris]|uniref:EF-hand domain-containing protein n=1 Tax=Pseudoxanthomonas putridarboris TaxID=752605 RepID=A0ABU9IYC9_9GAMM